MMPIHHTFAPLADAAQCLRALALLVQPWRYARGPCASELERELHARFGGEAFTFASGREALLALLHALKLRSGEEVIVQGYTCVVVPNAIHAAGGVPIYVDINRETVNLDLSEVEQAITSRTRAVICQHTFGIPADTRALRTVCDQHNLILIEDCAHILPDHHGPHAIGEHGDFLILSFGRDKAISGVTGGAVLSRRPSTSQGLRLLQREARDLRCLTVLQLLLYPLLYAIAKPLYGIRVGKALLAAARALRFLPPILTKEEKEGRMPPHLHRMPNACAALALAQLHTLHRFNDHRRQLTRFYLEVARTHRWPYLRGIEADLPLQKFPLFVRGAERIRQHLREKNIHLDDGWTGCVICPPSVDATELGYTAGRDPHAEELCESILSLPTHPTMTLRQARRLSTALHPLL